MYRKDFPFCGLTATPCLKQSCAYLDAAETPPICYQSQTLIKVFLDLFGGGVGLTHLPLFGVVIPLPFEILFYCVYGVLPAGITVSRACLVNTDTRRGDQIPWN